jgi:hypothetical protein
MARPKKILTEKQAEIDLKKTQEALELLRQARDHLSDVGAVQTLERVRLAISSCTGAVRHAQGRWAYAIYSQERGQGASR